MILFRVKFLVFFWYLMTAGSSFAQTLVSLNSEIPMMGFRVCPTLSDAKQDANLAWSLGKKEYQEGSLNSLRHKECDLVFATVTPIKEETSIRPFSTWTLSYDESSPDSLKAPSIGPNASVKVAPALQRVRFFYSRFQTSNGKTFYGWVEIPEEPYLVKYLAEKKRLQAETNPGSPRASLWQADGIVPASSVKEKPKTEPAGFESDEEVAPAPSREAI